MAPLLALLMIWLSAGACSPAEEETMDWPSVKSAIRERFPGVSQVSTEELAERLDRPEADRPILLDARTEAEFAVSHLRDAFLIESEDDALEVLEGEPTDREIVVYCSVGYRSSELSEKLEARGFTNVRNLEGSIFEWANQGRPVYGENEEPVRAVHPYDDRWGQLLDRGLWATAPQG